MHTVTLQSSQPLIAGMLSTWHYKIVLRGAPIRKGGCIKISYDLRGESGYYNNPQAENPLDVNYFSVQGPEDVKLEAVGYIAGHAWQSKNVQLEERIVSESYLWRDLLGLTSSLNLHIAKITVVSGELKAGDVLRVTYGDTSYGSPGMTVPGQAKPFWNHWVAVERREGAPPELLGGDYLVIRTGPTERLNVVAPSIVIPGEKISVAHVALDKHGNPVCRSRTQFPAPTVDEATAILKKSNDTIPVNRIQVEDSRVGLTGKSNPVAVVEDPEYRLFWGDIHGHTVMSDGGNRTPHDYYRWGRDTALLDFCAVTDHDFGIALYDSEKNWSVILEAASDFLEPGRFVTIPGWEVSHAGNIEGKGYGHKNFYFIDNNPPFYSSSPYGKERAKPDYVNIEQLVERLEADGVTFMIIEHTSHQGTDSAILILSWIEG